MRLILVPDPTTFHNSGSVTAHKYEVPRHMPLPDGHIPLPCHSHALGKVHFGSNSAYILRQCQVIGGRKGGSRQGIFNPVENWDYNNFS